MLESSYGMALITGASGGIGREFALQLAHAGWKLLFVGRNIEHWEETRRARVGDAGSGLFGQSVGLPAKKNAARLGLNILSLTSLCALLGREMRAGLRALCADRPYAVVGACNDIGHGLSKLVPRSTLPTLAKPFLDRLTRERTR
jgi:NAD(P)-dependent dehydrogenase (short-subunit alcohol dehydrogenase family)